MREERSTFSEDLLNRKNIAVNLTKIIENKNDLRVLAIDSKWGSGKTTFITMWKNMIKEEQNDKFETMYFNAWENDYIEEPLLSLLDELNKQIFNTKGECEKLGKKFKKKVKPLGKMVGRLALNMMTRGILDKVVRDENTENALYELSDKLGDLAIGNLNNEKKTREIIKEMLVEFQRETNKKVIIFIDELDRCRPTFAIELLETIKHIFDVENYIFVVSVDKEQLSHSIKTLYGQGMDLNGYLRRFFDLEYMLPRNNIEKYISYKNKKIFGNNPKEITKYILENVLLKETYSLRDIDKIYQYLDVILPIILQELKIRFYDEVGEYCINYIFVALLNLKFKNSELFNKILKGDYNIDLNKKSEFNIINLTEIDMSNLIEIKNNKLRYKSLTEIKEIMKNISEQSLDKYLYLCMKRKDASIQKEFLDMEKYDIYIDENHKEEGSLCNIVKLLNQWDILDQMTFVEQFKI